MQTTTQELRTRSVKKTAEVEKRCLESTLASRKGSSLWLLRGVSARLGRTFFL